MRVYVGLASTVHDPAIAVVAEGGEVLFAEATERPLQVKRAWHTPPDLPSVVDPLLERFVPPGAEVVVAQSWNSRRWTGPLFRAAYRLAESRVPVALRPTVLGQMNSFDVASLELEHRLRVHDPEGPRLYRRHFDHHLTHAAAACFASGLSDAAVAIVDANGERSSESCFVYDGGRLTPLDPPTRRPFRQRGSLGAFYAALCLGCGFDPTRGEEWKVMGLAAYGNRDDALFRRLRGMIGVDGLRLVGDPYRTIEVLRVMRRPGPALDSADLACTGQAVFADVMSELLTNLRRRTGARRVVLGGGCALNSLYNGQLCARTGFDELFVWAAPGDDGNALGAAWLAEAEDRHGPPPRARLSPYLGSHLDAAALDRVPRLGGLVPMPLEGVTALQRAGQLVAEGKVVAVAHGRAEHGPRALGHRSILADPRDPDIQRRLNAQVKFREAFRPFAPSVLSERAEAWFEDAAPSPYMERALNVRPGRRAEVPGITHVDGTARLQTVERAWSPGFASLIDAFCDKTGVPMVLNTSFNVMGKPIVHSVEDALAVFFSTGIDALVLEDRLYLKERT
ncbi:MAG: carbamoyltransferase [Sandaracinaceae bacterium]